MKKVPMPKNQDSEIEVEEKKTIELTDDEGTVFEEPSPISFTHLPEPKIQATAISMESIKRRNSKTSYPTHAGIAWEMLKDMKS